VFIRVLAGLALVLVNVLLVMIVMLVLSLPPAVAQLGGGLQGLTGSPERLAHAFAARSAELVQEFTDVLDPTHPPRQPLAQDVEFIGWTRVGVGGVVATSGQNQLTLAEVRRRPDASSADHAAFAVIRQSAGNPRITTIFGVPIQWSGRDSSQSLFKGESFQVGDTFYKVNWVSAEPAEIAVAQYRRRSDVPSALKFVAP
jgi:hypothetical protein